MSKNKLKKYAEVEQFSNVIELTEFNEDKEKPKGKWNERIFGNDKPLTLELACGKGEYTVALAEKYQDHNFIGIDIKGDRIWKGAKTALQRELDNVRFLRISIDHLEQYFSQGEINEIWITFPDPFEKWKKRKRRLTSPKFLNIYRNVLRSSGYINLKTDSDVLFEYTLEILNGLDQPIERITTDIYKYYPDDEWLTLKTYYEKQHLEEGRIIKFVRFLLDDEKLDRYLQK